MNGYRPFLSKKKLSGQEKKKQVA